MTLLPRGRVILIAIIDVRSSRRSRRLNCCEAWAIITFKSFSICETRRRSRLSWQIDENSEIQQTLVFYQETDYAKRTRRCIYTYEYFEQLSMASKIMMNVSFAKQCDSFVQLNSDNALDSIIEHLAEFPFKRQVIKNSNISKSFFRSWLAIMLPHFGLLHMCRLQLSNQFWLFLSH